MKQTLAIFIKDARRFWPEILLSFAILLALVLVYPRTWAEATEPTQSFSMRGLFSHGGVGFFAGCIVVLVPISWWLLIARLVHGERLVGSTQFWLTRPYEWPKFLGAKLLFLATFLYLPFLVAQCVLLAEGGFNPASYLPGLFYNLLLATGALILPLAALSVVTTGFGRMTLVILGVILFIAGVAFLNSLLPAETTGGVSGSLGDTLSFGMLVCGCSAVVVVQYARRKLWMAWLMIAAVAVSLSGLALTDPDQALMGRYYPALATGAPPPAEIVYMPNETHKPVANETQNKNELEIAIPLQATGVTYGQSMTLMAVKAAMQAPNGARWESSWNSLYLEHLLPGTSEATVRFRMRRSVYEQFKAKPASLRLTFAINQARAASTASIPLPLGEFTVPGFGICTPQTGWFSYPREVTGITCRTAMRYPRLTYVTAHWSEGPCTGGDGNERLMLGTAWAGSFDSDPAEFGITSVWETPLSLSNSWAGYKGTIQARRLCPGSPVTFTRYELTGHVQMAITIPDFRLPELAAGDMYLLKNDMYRLQSH
jgi:hypothetical protein